jgi:hypothetical protein
MDTSKEDLEKQLAASQHREKVLMELLCRCDFTWQGKLKAEVEKALSLPLDTSAGIEAETKTPGNPVPRKLNHP